MIGNEMSAVIRCARFILIVSTLTSGAASAEDHSAGSRPSWLRPLSLNVLAEVRHVSQGVVGAYNADTDDEISSTGFSELNQVIREAKDEGNSRSTRITNVPAMNSNSEIDQQDARTSVQLSARESPLKERAGRWVASMRSKADFLESSVRSGRGDSSRNVNDSMRIQRAAVFRKIAETLDRSINDESQTEEIVDLTEFELSRTEFPNFRFQDPTPTMSVPSFKDESPGVQ